MPNKSPPVTASLGLGNKPSRPAKEARRQAKILLLDNDLESRRFIHGRLTRANYQVDAVDDPQAALDFCVRSRPNLVITDLLADPLDGLALLKELKSRWPTLAVIIVAAHATIAEAVLATQSGAFGFLVKPIEKAELLGQVERAIAASTFALADATWRSEIVTRSHLMEDRLALAHRAAESDVPVLLTGEHGTGKELLARAIHAAGTRRREPFVSIRCKDAIELALESDLFGDAAAFEDDPAAHAGALDRTGAGTLLIEEISYLPHRLQGELMRTLRRSPHSGGPRLICTTSRDLKTLSDAGEFRQDLYSHINILPIEIPPLGRRREDIPLLVSHFLERATDEGSDEKLYTPDAIELLSTTDWPGNVRQLFELVKKNVALSSGKVMSKEFVEQSLGRAAPKVPSYHEARESFARTYLSSKLEATCGNVNESARLAKRNRTNFYKLLARYRVKPEKFKKGSREG